MFLLDVLKFLWSSLSTNAQQRLFSCDITAVVFYVSEMIEKIFVFIV